MSSIKIPSSNSKADGQSNFLKCSFVQLWTESGYLGKSRFTRTVYDTSRRWVRRKLVSHTLLHTRLPDETHGILDILFSNIKHLFFQPCDHELLVIVHIHLKSPMMIGKRKAHVRPLGLLVSLGLILKGRQDVQFFREASDVQFDETGNRKRKYRYGDEDEIELEQQERKRRQILNREFKAFAEKVAEAATAAVSSCINDPPYHPSEALTPSLVTLLRWMCHSESSRLRVSHTGQMSACNRRQIAWYTSPILHSWSSL